MNSQMERCIEHTSVVWKIPSQKFLPCGVEMYRPPAYGYVHQPGSSPDLVLWEFLWQFHQVGLIVNLISSPSYIFP